MGACERLYDRRLGSPLHPTSDDESAAPSRAPGCEFLKGPSGMGRLTQVWNQEEPQGYRLCDP